MAKGKKKGGKDNEPKETASVEATTSAVTSLNISETPSTSQNPPVEEEEDVGLTGGGGGKKKRPKKKNKQEASSSTTAAEVKVTPVSASAETKPVAVETAQQQDVQSKGAPQSAWMPKSRGVPPQTAGLPQSAALPPQTPGLPQSAGWPQSAGLPPQSAGLPQSAGWPQTASEPQGHGRGRGRGAGRGAGPGRGAGRGAARGWGAGDAPQTVPYVPSPTPSAPEYSNQPGPSARAQVAPAPAAPAYTTLPASQSKAVTPIAPKSMGSDTPMCRFQIPKKILGNTVPVRAIQVITNYLQMSIKPIKVFRYDIIFKPDRPKKALPKAFAASKNRHFPRNVIAFDQIKNCYTTQRLPNVTQTDRFMTNVEILDNNGKTMAFEVSYKFTGVVDLGTLLTYMQTGATSLSPPTEAIQCIDVVLRQGTLENYVKAGRQFFQRPSRPIDLGDGLEMWTGLFQSGIFTTQPFINIDVAHKGFPKQQPMIEAIQKDFRLDPRRPLDTQARWSLEKLNHFLKGLRVVANIGGDKSAAGQRREYICNGLVGSATKERFAYEDPATKVKKSMTVAEYFMRIKGVRLQYPDLNCIWVGPREKTIYYPIELLEVGYGQPQNKQLNEDQLKTMVRQAATPPDERKRKIEEVIRSMNYSRNPTFQEFGLNISNEFYPVKAKILIPPKLDCGRGQVLEPRKGVWQANQVYRPEALQAWGFIAIECDPNRCNYDAVKDMLMKTGRMMGMTVAEPMLARYNVTMRDLQNVLFDALHKEIKFLFIVVSNRGRDYYHRVKQIAERDVGILTQCIKEQTASMKMNMQTAKNILLKVNSKLMGINQALDGRSIPKCLKEGGVMVVGADVTHPSPDQTSIPSIAAVTASIDPQCFKYNIELSIQTPKKEMIVEFEEMMVDHLKVYRQHQKALPKKIFVFRDGVSEGQFAQVMNSELQAVYNAYKVLAGPNARPEVLFLLVQKRHNTRLFLPGSNQNVDPGTCVDTDIVHASELDFYLVSHQAIKGTARPTRYHAVCNDGKIPHDEVEQLAYYLCHLYSRCMRAVSYPTPTYYAHLACLRARSLTHGEKFDNTELEQRPKRLRVMDKILQYSRMFFV